MKGIYNINGVDFYKYNIEIDWSGKHFEQYPEAVKLKHLVGVYAFTLCGEIVYVGSSINLFGRLQTHIRHMQGKPDNLKNSRLEQKKYYYLNKYIDQVNFIVLDVYDNAMSKEKLEEHEYLYIHKYCPIFNINYKDVLKRWSGTEQDIDAFVNGVTTIDTLKTKFINPTK